MRITTQGEPVHLQLPPEWPAPRPGCAECTALAAQREQARTDRDMSLVSDCNVKMRKHHLRRRQPATKGAAEGEGES